MLQVDRIGGIVKQDVFDIDQIAICQQQGTLNDILELTHVAVTARGARSWRR